jgi:hypothetical protein
LRHLRPPLRLRGANLTMGEVMIKRQALRFGKLGTALRLRQAESARVDYLAGAVEILGGIEAAAKRVRRTPDELREWLRQGLRHVIVGRVCDLAQAAGVPLDLMFTRMGRYRGPRLEGEALKQATLRGVEAYHARKALSCVKISLESVSHSIQQACDTHWANTKHLHHLDQHLQSDVGRLLRTLKSTARRVKGVTQRMPAKPDSPLAADSKKVS